MSSWINTTSMAGFSGAFAAGGKYHLLDADEYWVKFPEFEHCDASRRLWCTVPEPYTTRACPVDHVRSQMTRATTVTVPR
ncbi:hypothetical protein [Streptomyces violaceusniger]|uniref:hypothetical protein n=1 Tax=Streptomyces violaceusniger TaxID=68280 RepID=UPI00380CB002